MSDNKNTANYCKHSKKSFTMAKKKHILVPTFEENKIIRLEVVFIQSIFKKKIPKNQQQKLCTIENIDYLIQIQKKRFYLRSFFANFWEFKN